MHGRADVSSFYFGNEQIAREFQRLVESGQLNSLLNLLKEHNCEIVLESRREEQGMSEQIGVFSANPRQNRSTARKQLPIYRGPDLDPLLRANGAWNALESICTRSQFTITRRNGTVEEVYMPDHVCPECLNEEGNVIDACQRVCKMCGFSW